MSDIPPYPLHWPDGVPRSARRSSSKFRTTLAGAVDNVTTSLRRFGADSGRAVSGVVATSNVLGLLGGVTGRDPGVAVWFVWDGEQRCFAVDIYDTVAANLQAIHHVIEARRTEMRHGGLSVVRQTFRGFTAALPAPGRPWWVVLGVDSTASADAIDAAYRRLAREHHPDRGGSGALMAELNAARDDALRARP